MRSRELILAERELTYPRSGEAQLPPSCVRGHEKVPAGGHLKSPLVATKVPTCGHEKSPPLTEVST